MHMIKASDKMHYLAHVTYVIKSIILTAIYISLYHTWVH